MGQITQSLMTIMGDHEGVEITTGEIEESQLEVLRIKQSAKGWANVKVEKLNALVSDVSSYVFVKVSSVDPPSSLRRSGREILSLQS